MSRANYSGGKRQRDADKARKKKAKERKRRERRAGGPAEVPIAEPEDITGDLEVIERQRRAERAAAEKDARGIPCRLFVGGLSWDTSEEDLLKAFSAHGPVVEAVIVNDRDTGRSRGFGFVTMQDRRDANKAIEALADTELDGRTIVVNVATERKR